eukprot:PhF_6_TR8450/c0_g1_i2/m.13177
MLTVTSSSFTPSTKFKSHDVLNGFLKDCITDSIICCGIHKNTDGNGDLASTIPYTLCLITKGGTEFRCDLYVNENDNVELVQIKKNTDRHKMKAQELNFQFGAWAKDYELFTLVSSTNKVDLLLYDKKKQEAKGSPRFSTYSLGGITEVKQMSLNSTSTLCMLTTPSQIIVKEVTWEKDHYTTVDACVINTFSLCYSAVFSKSRPLTVIASGVVAKEGSEEPESSGMSHVLRIDLHLRPAATTSTSEQPPRRQSSAQQLVRYRCAVKVDTMVPAAMCQQVFSEPRDRYVVCGGSGGSVVVDWSLGKKVAPIVVSESSVSGTQSFSSSPQTLKVLFDENLENTFGVVSNGNLKFTHRVGCTTPHVFNRRFCADGTALCPPPILAQGSVFDIHSLILPSRVNTGKLRHQFVYVGPNGFRIMEWVDSTSQGLFVDRMLPTILSGVPPLSWEQFLHGLQCVTKDQAGMIIAHPMNVSTILSPSHPERLAQLLQGAATYSLDKEAIMSTFLSLLRSDRVVDAINLIHCSGGAGDTLEMLEHLDTALPEDVKEYLLA